jgi:sec-independent protein translocase protein TatC
MEKFNEKIYEYLDYFESIRKTVYNLAIVFVISFVLGFFNSGFILKHIVKYFNLQNASIVATSPFQFIDLSMTIGMYSGFIVCLPLFIFYLYKFMKEGLNREEKKVFFVLLPVGLLLFIIGFAYGVFVLDFALSSIAKINVGLGIENFWDIATFLSQILLSSVLLGLLFQFPILLTFLIRVGVLNSQFLKKNRRIAYVIILTVTSFLPPTDGLSLIIMVTPLILIYEVTIIVNLPRRPMEEMSVINPKYE